MGKPGPKPLPPGEKRRRGTDQPSRDIADLIQLDAGVDGAVERPEGLSAAAEIIWNDLAPMAQKMGTLKPQDAFAFAQLCVMCAHLQACWSIRDDGTPDGEPAPASYIQQWRQLSEMFGLAGIRSRLVPGAGKGDGDPRVKGNPFSRNAR